MNTEWDYKLNVPRWIALCEGCWGPHGLTCSFCSLPVFDLHEALVVYTCFGALVAYTGGGGGWSWGWLGEARPS